MRNNTTVFDSRRVFSDHGILSQKLPGYENRAGQVDLAEAIERVFESKKHLVAEAPCGVGKSFAYLIPAIYHARSKNKKVIVATANITLQEQLCAKDLPFLARVLPVKFTYALIKGISNYLCVDKLEESQKRFAQGDLFEMQRTSRLNQQFRELLKWAEKTETGDSSELSFEPDDEVWSKVACGYEECTGKDCPSYNSCFAIKARKKAKECDIIICNYHILFAHLHLKAQTGEAIILPDYSYLVCDEGHEIADIAREFWGMKITGYSINRIKGGVRLMGRVDLDERLKRESDLFFERVKLYAKSERYQIRLREPDFVDGENLFKVLSEYQEVLKKGIKDLEDDEIEKTRLNALRRYLNLASGYFLRLRESLSLKDKNSVYWIEFDKNDRPSLQSKLIEAGEILSRYLFGGAESVIATSATLATNNNFDFIRREIGLVESEELIVDSPFDFKKQALLILPAVKTHPRDEAFADDISEIIKDAISVLKGRTMVLFTSYRVLDKVSENLASCPAKILKQGDMPRNKLLDKFRKDEGYALLATRSFWQGVDIPGEALSCLIIDKIPFEPPDDPIIDAIRERCDDFIEYNLPRATILLRQGFGRLIRTKNDRGIVILLDPRLRQRGYGKRILASLPDCVCSCDLKDLRDFLEK